MNECIRTLADSTASLALAAAIGSFVAGWFGVVTGRMAYHWMFTFLRRTPRWRRFDRAMRRLLS